VARNLTEGTTEPDVERDADGEPVGRSDREADVVSSGTPDPEDQHLNEDALDAFVSRDRPEGQ
jgi:hypothetical protein